MKPEQLLTLRSPINVNGTFYSSEHDTNITWNKYYNNITWNKRNNNITWNKLNNNKTWNKYNNISWNKHGGL